MDRKTYRVDATREGRWWIVSVPAIDYRTQARALGEIEEMGRDLISTMEDVEPDSFDVELSVTIPSDVRDQLDEAARLEQQARDSSAAAARDRRAAARALRDRHGLPAVDVATVLGVTRARAYQLLDDPAKAPRSGSGSVTSKAARSGSVTSKAARSGSVTSKAAAARSGSATSKAAAARSGSATSKASKVEKFA